MANPFSRHIPLAEINSHLSEIIVINFVVAALHIPVLAGAGLSGAGGQLPDRLLTGFPAAPPGIGPSFR
jgi:hypothetical protein